MLISANLVRSAAHVVRSVLAERDSKLAFAYAGCLIAAQRDIERRLGVAMRRESVAITDLRQRAQLQLADCVANYALALLGARHRETALRQQVAHSGVTTLVEWAQQRRQDPKHSMLALFEQWIIQGHPLHPAAKVRVGMNPAEVLATCPEWGNTVELRVVALHHAAAQEYGSAITQSPAQQRPLTDLLLREHPQLQAAVVAEYGAQQRFQDSVTLLPVHPWQADHVLPQRFGCELSDGTLRFLPVRIPARPLVSYRTLIPVATPTAPHPSHLKTALSVQLTNALRGVSPSAAHNGPQVSRLLEEILRREHYFSGRLQVLTEPAAAHFQFDEPQTATNAQALPRSCELAALARHNPELDLGEDELLLPAGALTARSPLSNQPILAELLDALRAAEPNAAVLGNRADAARYFAYRYAQVCVPPLLTLLTRYGVALEAHGENLLLGIRGGEPHRCMVRDFGGVRIHSQRLAKQQLHIQLRAGSVITTNDDHELRHKLYFALFTNELNQLVSCLSMLSGLPTAQLWQPFHVAAAHTFDKLATEPGIRRAAQEDARALLEQHWPYKAMLSMWLRGEVTDYSYLPTHNPFAVTSRGNA
ncbi:MAG: hypothetical protein DLM55_04610 [Acidimicrobiales bacterium]|nr:MAG: hypothetical protein DLM55_04610 [Acidimicrobiales bacterium]